jgi:septation ring formation regulator EzrA
MSESEIEKLKERLDNYDGAIKALYDLVGKLARAQHELTEDLRAIIGALQDFKDQYDIDHPIEGDYHE